MTDSSLFFYKEELNKLIKNEGYILLSEYINSQTKVKIKHISCGDEFEITPNKFKQGRRCPKCSGVKRYTTVSYKDLIQDKTNNEWTITSEYINSQTKVKFKHVSCGNELEKTPNNFQFKNIKCNKCLKEFNYYNEFNLNRNISRSKKSIDDWKKDIYNIYGDKYTLLSKTVNGSKDVVNIQCNICDNISSKRLDAFIYHREECIYCKDRINIKTKISNDDFIKEGYTLIDNIEDIKNNKQPLNLLHSKCNNIYKVTYKDFFYKKHRCPHCKVSNSENEIINFIKENYSGTIILHDRNTIKPKELDIYLPEIKLAIEYNGSYYHRSEKLGNMYHQNKTLECDDKGIRLIHIFDSDWKHKESFIKRKLLISLNKDNRKRLFARNTIFKIEYDKNKIKEFYELNHIQGFTNNFLYSFSLYNDETLLANILLSKPSKLSGSKDINNNELEVIRYCTDSNYCIIGGYSKLIKNLKSYLPSNINKLFTYANLRYDNGKLYELNNWTLECLTKPSYFYIKGNSGEELHRTSFTKDKIKKKYPEIYNETLTEYEMSLKLNLHRMYDCGKLKYFLNI